MVSSMRNTAHRKQAFEHRASVYTSRTDRAVRVRIRLTAGRAVGLYSFQQAVVNRLVLGCAVHTLAEFLKFVSKAK